MVALAVGAMGCSAQKPGSKVDGSHSENKLALDKSLTLSAQPSRSPVRIDYLRHLSGIQNPELFIYKERRRLYVVDANVVVRDYPVGLGKQPWGDKEREGDGRTPEGAFMVYSTSSLPDHGLGLKVSEDMLPAWSGPSAKARPSLPHFGNVAAGKGLRNSGQQPGAWKGKFSIHGGGAQADWTDGTVALYASDMEELSQIVSLGTSVIVRP
ncbi:MAG: L,D-transpeptidase [Syntrophobacteraceae bacterium]|jgi:hypothetical protein|nr:L,D-transpeptidase [Syntrophobacteraceae bacterium]